MKWLFSIIILIVLLGCSEEVEEITIEVISKDTNAVQVVYCTMIGKVNSCRPKLVTKYYISSLSEQFNISPDLYNEIEVGEKYVVYITKDRRIIKILKE